MTTNDEPSPRPRTGDRDETRASRHLAFAPSLRPLLAFLVATTVLMPALLLLADRVLPRTPLASNLFTAIGITGVALVAWVVLRWEGVSAADVGLDRERIVSGIVPVAAIWVGVNVLGYVLLALLGEQPRLGLPADPMMGLPVGAPTTQVAGAAIVLWVFVGNGEEFAFRAYLQNKIIAHLGSGTRSRKAVGIVGTAVLFALWHLPTLVWIRSAAGQQLLVLIGFITVYTVVLGTLYELTRNVVLVGLFHGTFDLNPIFVVGDAGEPVTGLTILVLPLALVVFWGYRRWARAERPTDFQPQTTAATAG